MVIIHGIFMDDGAVPRLVEAYETKEVAEARVEVLRRVEAEYGSSYYSHPVKVFPTVEAREEYYLAHRRQ